MKTVTYTLSEAADQKRKDSAKLKSREQRYIWKAIKDDHPELFKELFDEFIKTQADDEQFELRS